MAFVVELGASGQPTRLCASGLHARLSHSDCDACYWLGAAASALATLVLLDTAFFAVDVGWRLGFAIGAVLGAVVLFARRFIPESPPLADRAWPAGAGRGRHGAN